MSSFTPLNPQVRDAVPGHDANSGVGALQKAAGSATPEHRLIELGYVPVRQLSGKVVGVWGDAHIRHLDGSVTVLHVGDVVKKGEVVLTAQDGIVQIEARHVAAAPATGDDVERTITQVGQEDPSVVPAAGPATGGSIEEGLRVGRDLESVTPLAFELASPTAAVQPLERQAVAPLTAAPVANPDADTTPVNTPVVFDTRGNDTSPSALTIVDIAGQAISAGHPVTLPQGSVALNPDGTLTFTPNHNFTGSLTFTYTGQDTVGGTATSTVTIDVVAPPVTARPDTNVVAENASVHGNLSGDATQVPGDTNTFTVGTSPTHGTLTLSPDGSYTYAPATGYAGTDSFSYVVTDVSGQTSSATVTLTVSPLPVVAKPDANTGPENSPIKGSVASDVTVIAGDANSFAVTQPAHGNVTIDDNGNYVYTPTTGYSGADSFTYTVADQSGQTSTATVTMTVTPLPITAKDDVNTGPENAPITGSVAGDATNIPGDPSTFTVGTQPTHGTVTVNANGSYTYTPATGYTGTDSFTYTVTDKSGATSNATVTLTVVPINPTAKSDVYTLNEDTVLTGQTVLANDTPVAGETNTWSVTALPTHGTLVPAPDFATSGKFTYTPDAHYTGTDTFTYTITDGSGHRSIATATLNVLPVAETPTVSLTTHTYSIGSTFEETSLAGGTFANLPVSGLTHGSETGGSTPDLAWHTGNAGKTVEIGVASTYAVTGDSTQLLELEQNPNDASNLYTNVNTRQGEVYTLSFDYAARGNADAGITKVVYVYWEGQLVDVLNSQSTAMTHYTLNVAATQTGSGRLEFVSGDSDSYGGVFDNIQFSLDQNTGIQGYSVPIPAISAALTNSDPGEVLHVAISAIPVGDTITDGNNTFTATAGTTSHDITGWDLSHVSLVSPASGDVTLGVTATAVDPNGTTASSSTQNVTLHVLPSSTGLSDTSGNTTSNETTPNEVLWALSGHTTLTGGSGNDTLIGGTGNETLTGGVGNNLISGGSGNDVLIGGSGNDTLSGGPGNDTMTGGGGVDVFKWHLGDQGTTSVPAVDKITDFNPAAVSAGGDILDLRDLLVGETRPAGTTGAGDLTNYLHFTVDTHGDTVIHVSSAGNFAAGGSGLDDQQIILSGVNLLGVNPVGTNTDAQIITTLLNEGKLVTNGH